MSRFNTMPRATTRYHIAWQELYEPVALLPEHEGISAFADFGEIPDDLRDRFNAALTEMRECWMLIRQHSERHNP